MKNKPILLLFALLSIGFTPCSYASSTVSVQQRLINKKWQLDKQIFANHDNTGTDSSTVTGNKNDFLEFKADGTVLVSFKGNKDTLQYKLINDSIINLGTNNYKITVLSDNSLHLYQDEQEENGDYNREWLQLQK